MKSPKEAGFIVLSLPLDQVEPLSLLARTSGGVIQRIGARLSDLFPERNYPLPGLIRDGSLPAGMTGEDELDLKIDAHMKFLEGLAKLVHVNLDASLTAARSGKCTFSINDPLLDTVSVFEMDKYISANPLTDTLSTFEDKLKDDDIFVVTELIKSKSFEITYDTSSGNEIRSDISVATAASAGAGGASQKKQKQTLKSGDNGKYLAIAIKAVQLKYDRPWWKSKDKAKYRINLDPVVTEARGPEDMKCDYLAVDEGFVNLEV